MHNVSSRPAHPAGNPIARSSRHVRVAIFTNTYHPTVNGVANCVDAYRMGLEARGHEVYVFAPCPNDYDASQDRHHVLRFPAMPLIGDWDYDIALPYSKPVMEALHDLKFDVVHTQHPVWVGVWGMWYARWAGLPLVTTVHTEYRLYAGLVPLPAPLVEWFLETRVSAYCNKCHLVTTPTQTTRERLRREGVTAPIEILHNPIDLRALPAPDPAPVRERHGIPSQAFLMGFIGRLAPEKDLPKVLSAAAQVLKEHPDARFLMGGTGPEHKPLVALAQRLGVADRVIFTGLIPHDQVTHYQAALDVFMTASMSETQPLSYTEAMAVGTPVVALRAPGAVDMIQHEHNGLLVEPEAGAEGLAAGARRLAQDSALRARLSEQAESWVRRYDLPTVLDRLLELYELTLARHAAHLQEGQD